MKSSTFICAAVAGIVATGPVAALDLESVRTLLDPETFTALLEQAEHDEMSPLGMFMAADWVVKSVMLSLLLASILVWVIFLAKVMILRWERGVLRRRYRALDRAGSLNAAKDLFAKKKGVVSQMVQAALRERAATGDQPELKSGIKERAGSEIARIEAGAARRMGFGAGVLANVGSVAPFVGLFGTVWGIMNSFISISESNTTNLAIVAPGIAEALLATAIGLVAAIPAVIFYNILARGMGGYKVMLADAGALVERTLSRDLDLAPIKDATFDEAPVDKPVFRLGSVSTSAAE
ncbi:Biopolymer transport protein [Sulfitobacter noctilucae]|uniref:tonB-system energizer ExbB n=1 Tax=Sulfitobacter noctilucae TaxID=1342302 RepID=UPI000468BB54|nr:tonB-system energizer ExbB [Sulfitobacter noctilucae]KIN74945.1 Biopolymer transport protein [Sulfitobacter noctilucae]